MELAPSETSASSVSWAATALRYLTLGGEQQVKICSVPKRSGKTCDLIKGSILTLSYRLHEDGFQLLRKI